jgi:hypothetical protein
VATRGIMMEENNEKAMKNFNPWRLIAMEKIDRWIDRRERL